MNIFKKPFIHCTIHNFLEDGQAGNLRESLLNQEFFLKNSDLFTFLQTNDLNNVKEFQEIKQKLLSEHFLQQIETITNTKLSTTKLDLFGTMYKNTHYLLPHDDQLEGRAVAFIYYLSTLKKKDGGALCLYNSKNNKPITISKCIQPTFNTLALFPVTKTSFHEVEEVLTNNDRLALTGWFYKK